MVEAVCHECGEDLHVCSNDEERFEHKPHELMSMTDSIVEVMMCSRCINDIYQRGYTNGVNEGIKAGMKI